MSCRNCGAPIAEGRVLCDTCARSGVNVYAGQGGTVSPKKKFNVRVFIIIISLAIVAFFGVIAIFEEDSETQGTEQVASGGNEEVVSAIVDQRKTVPYSNDTGALFNMTLEEFSPILDEKIEEFFKEEMNSEMNSDITGCWGKMVEAQVFTEETSGCEATLHTAVVNDKYLITATTMEDKISSISVQISTESEEDNAITKIIMSASVGVMDGIKAVEAENNIVKIIGDEMQRTGQMVGVYKEGVLYTVTTSDGVVNYEIIAASVDFVKRLENSNIYIVYK